MNVQYPQPFILYVGHETGHKQFHCSRQNGYSSWVKRNIVEVADKLFESHYGTFLMLDMPHLSNKFWQSVASVIYEVSPPTEVKSLVRSLATSVRAVSLQ